MTGTQAVIPVKRLGRALGRLAALLSPRERRDLQRVMLLDLLDACRATPQLAEVVVVTADDEAAGLAGDRGARILADHRPARGMNAAVGIGIADAARLGRRALVLTADLPLARPQDLAAVVAAAPDGGVVLVPSRDGTGTNAMLLAPPEAIPTRLGPDSRARHRAEVRARGLRLTEIEVPRLALDIDTPEDLILAARYPADCRTVAACRALDVAGRRVAETSR